jgi:YidC/Oxa1 family membrane protein insertase
MRDLAAGVLGAFSSFLELLHSGLEPVFGIHAWGWSIVALTLIARIALLPLAIKQTRSMKAVQKLQPQIKAIQQKYKVDRELMRKDPEKYRTRKAKLNEELMALYQREGANPAASCLPLLAQAPIFLALFWTLRDEAELIGAPFYFFTEATPGGLEKLVSAAGWPGVLLIILMSGTMFFSQKQMMARSAASMADNPMAQQQKILLYVMPVFLAAISFGFPLGILLYWVTTNFWQIAQQAIILRETSGPVNGNGNGNGKGDVAGGGAGSGAEGARRSKGATSGRAKPAASDPEATPSAQPEESSINGGSLESPVPGTPARASTGPDVGPSGTDGGTGADTAAAAGPGAPRERLPRRGGNRPR